MASKLMAAVCLIPPSGHDRTLEAITECADIKEMERFAPIVQGKVELNGNEWNMLKIYGIRKYCLFIDELPIVTCKDFK